MSEAGICRRLEDRRLETGGWKGERRVVLDPGVLAESESTILLLSGQKPTPKISAANVREFRDD
jgi:hypothetical protein